MKTLFRAATLTLGLVACKKAETAPVYEKGPVARRDIVVTASAAGAIQPMLTVEVKSKASGEIISMRVQQERYRVGASTILDLLTSQANLTQAETDLVQARFDYLIARAQLEALVGRTL